MKYKGSADFEEFWHFLESESPRGVAVVIAAHFDEKLGQLLDLPDTTFFGRIKKGLAVGQLTQNEHDDLLVIKDLRNDFAHNLRDKDFDTGKTIRVNCLNTWKIAAETWPFLQEDFITAKDRILYVAGVFFVRFKHRGPRTGSPLKEPELWDTEAWLPISSH